MVEEEQGNRGERKRKAMWDCKEHACMNFNAIWLTDSLSRCIESTCTEHVGATSHAIGRPKCLISFVQHVVMSCEHALL